jgi:2-polyprenyl-3-methyl-5-hydroxy-6-metoxy-1,4-benzoquinol methylase
MSDNKTTQNKDYAERLRCVQDVWWKRLLDVQAPYRWNIRKLNLGFTLDIGCGLGRNLSHLEGNAVGVDHNPHSINCCKEQGFNAYTADEFLRSVYAKEDSFDSILLFHIIEHMNEEENLLLINSYMKYLKKDGKIVIITPQSAGFKSDYTHIWLAGFNEIKSLCSKLGLIVEKEYSFPFPSFVGHIFKYNENVVVARKVK